MRRAAAALLPPHDSMAWCSTARSLTRSLDPSLSGKAQGDAVLEVDVGGGDDAGPERELVLGAERAEGAVFEDAEELGLELGGHLGDLVEQQRARAGELELAADAALGAGEGAALVAED